MYLEEKGEQKWMKWEGEIKTGNAFESSLSMISLFLSLSLSVCLSLSLSVCRSDCLSGEAL